ncbi:MAG: zinc ribbon domain-containing protein [Acidobacteria bacterium]|nr:zinc ribbon domain-containing protein [Acidobacteriota bacterium]
MFCPRCGSQNTDTTKYCRQCGLPLTQLTGYVATGGTAPLQPLPPLQQASSALSKMTEGLSPKQKMVMRILLFVFSTAIFGALGELIPFAVRLAPVAGVMMIFGILWSVFSYKAEVQRLSQSQPIPPQPLFQQNYQPPQIAPSPTNKIANPMRPSVTEDETQKLPGQN